MFKKNKIKTGWDAYESKKKKKEKYTWVAKHTYRSSKEISFFERVIKILISFSLLLTTTREKRINPIKKRELVDTTYENLSSPKFNFIPAGLGLYLFFSMIPIFILVSSSIELFSSIPTWSGGQNMNWGQIFREDILSKIIPGIDALITDVEIKDIFLSLTIVFLFISSIWFSSKGLTKFIDSQSTIYDHKNQTNFLIKRFRAILMVILISLFFTIALISFIPLIGYFQQIFPPSIDSITGSKTFGLQYQVVFYFSMFIFISFWNYIGIGLLFRFSPLFKLRWKEITPGILITTIPMVIFIMSFGYLTSLIDYSKYGAIGTFLYAITFVFILSYFLYAGIIINASYYKTFFSLRIISKKWFLTNIMLEKLDIFKKHR